MLFSLFLAIQCRASSFLHTKSHSNSNCCTFVLFTTYSDEEKTDSPILVVLVRLLRAAYIHHLLAPGFLLQLYLYIYIYIYKLIIDYNVIFVIVGTFFGVVVVVVVAIVDGLWWQIFFL